MQYKSCCFLTVVANLFVQELTQPQTQRSMANVCLFCNEALTTPSMCTFCGFKFCSEHISTQNHQCIKTRYVEYIKKTNSDRKPNIISGKFRVVCDVCGFCSTKGAFIEFAGEELTQHTQIAGCSQNVFLEEVVDNTNVREGKEKHQNTDAAVPDSDDNQSNNEGKIKLQPVKTGSKLLSNNSNSGKNYNNNEKSLSQSTQKTSVVDQLFKLALLKEKGMISNAEFIYIKREMLKKLR